MSAEAAKPSPAQSILFCGLALLYAAFAAVAIHRDSAWLRAVDVALLLLTVLALTQFAVRLIAPARTAQRTAALSESQRKALGHLSIVFVVFGILAAVSQMIFQQGVHPPLIRYFIVVFIVPTAINDFLGRAIDERTTPSPPSLTLIGAAPIRSSHWNKP